MFLGGCLTITSGFEGTAPRARGLNGGLGGVAKRSRVRFRVGKNDMRIEELNKELRAHEVQYIVFFCCMLLYFVVTCS